MGKKIVSGEKIEPHPIKGKAGSIPVTVQAAYDATNVYLRFQWKDPAASGGEKMDKDNSVKLAVMLEGNKVDMADQVGCWATCHQDSRTSRAKRGDNDGAEPVAARRRGLVSFLLKNMDLPR